MYEELNWLCQTRSLWTRPCEAKPRPAFPNHHIRSALLWDIMQHSVNSIGMLQDNLSIPFSRVRKSKREKSTTEVNYTIFLFGTSPIVYFLIEAQRFRSWLCFYFQAKKHIIWWMP